MHWFQAGHHRILEHIFLSLPLRTILVCNQVSKKWQVVAQRYHRSKIPRILKLQEKKISCEWLKKNPYIEFFPIVEFKNLITHDLVADEEVIVLACSMWGLGIESQKIFIYDAKTIKLTHTFDINSRLANSDVPFYKVHNTCINLSMYKKYLAATLTSVINDECFLTVLIWNRSDNYFENPLVVQRKKPRSLSTFYFTDTFLPTNSYYVDPRAFEDKLYLPIHHNHQPNFKEIIYSCWNIVNGTFEENISKTHTTSSSKSYINTILVPFSTDILIFDEDSREGTISRSALREDKLLWTISKKRQIPLLIGINETFLWVEWKNPNTYRLPKLNIHDLKDGNLIQAFKVDIMRGLRRVQIKNNRVAIQWFDKGDETSINVFSLLNGQKIFSIGKKVGLTGHSRFVLERDKILIRTKHGFVTVSFWK